MQTPCHRTLSFHGIRFTQLIQVLTPQIYLFCQINLYRTHIRTRITKRTSRYVIIIMQRSLQHTQINANRSRNKISIRITTTAAIHRTSIHAGTATDAIQRLYVLPISQYFTTTIIYYNNMKLPAFPRFTKMRSISSDRLSGG